MRGMDDLRQFLQCKHFLLSVGEDPSSQSLGSHDALMAECLQKYWKCSHSLRALSNVAALSLVLPTPKHTEIITASCAMFFRTLYSTLKTSKHMGAVDEEAMGSWKDIAHFVMMSGKCVNVDNIKQTLHYIKGGLEFSADHSEAFESRKAHAFLDLRDAEHHLVEMNKLVYFQKVPNVSYRDTFK
jgi:hypothetical protein